MEQLPQSVIVDHMPGHRAALFADRFKAISSCAEKLAFPDYRKGILNPKDLSGKNWPAKWIYNLSHPLTTTDNPASLFYLTFLGFSVVQYLAFMLGWTFLFAASLNSPVFISPVTLESLSFIILGVVLGLACAVISYAWWWETLISRKNFWGIKIIVIAIVSLSLWKLSSLLLENVPVKPVWDNPNEIAMVLASFGLFLIPATSYFWALAFDGLSWGWLVYCTLAGGISSIHAPRPIQTILTLAIQEIPPSEPYQLSWRLVDLPKDDIIQMRQWAEANREGSEKRTVPAFLVSALVGILLTSDLIRGAGDRFLASLARIVEDLSRQQSILPLSINTILLLMAVLMLLILAMVVTKNLVDLFRNIVAQNLIVEACIVAEYAVNIPALTPQPKKPGLLVWIIQWLFGR